MSVRICARRPGFLLCVQAGGCGCRCVFELGKEAPTGARNGLMINDQGECSVGGTPQQPQPLNKSRRVMLPAPRSSSHSFTPQEKKKTSPALHYSLSHSLLSVRLRGDDSETGPARIERACRVMSPQRTASAFKAGAEMAAFLGSYPQLEMRD